MKLHHSVMRSVHARNAESNNIKCAEYFRQVKTLLREGNQKEAFTLLQEAVSVYPSEPTMMSYYGYLLAVVERKYRIGIETCLKAIERLKTLEKQNEKRDGSMPYPIFYFNLGRAYSAAGKRKESLDALNKGLTYDPSNGEIKKELQRMGVRRKKPPIPFLDRANPLNKYLGIALYRSKK